MGKEQREVKKKKRETVWREGIGSKDEELLVQSEFSFVAKKTVLTSVKHVLSSIKQIIHNNVWHDWKGSGKVYESREATNSSKSFTTFVVIRFILILVENTGIKLVDGIFQLVSITNILFYDSP